MVVVTSLTAVVSPIITPNWSTRGFVYLAATKGLHMVIAISTHKGVHGKRVGRRAGTPGRELKRARVHAITR